MPCAMESKVSNSCDQLELGLVRHANPHEIWVDLKANDGQDISKDLFALPMRKANQIPKLEKSGEIGREVLVIPLVEQPFTTLLHRE